MRNVRLFTFIFIFISVGSLNAANLDEDLLKFIDRQIEDVTPVNNLASVVDHLCHSPITFFLQKENSGDIALMNRNYAQDEIRRAVIEFFSRRIEAARKSHKYYFFFAPQIKEIPSWLKKGLGFELKPYAITIQSSDQRICCFGIENL